MPWLPRGLLISPGICTYTHDHRESRDPAQARTETYYKRQTVKMVQTSVPGRASSKSSELCHLRPSLLSLQGESCSKWKALLPCLGSSRGTRGGQGGLWVTITQRMHSLGFWISEQRKTWQKQGTMGPKVIDNSPLSLFLGCLIRKNEVREGRWSVCSWQPLYLPLIIPHQTTWNV